MRSAACSESKNQEREKEIMKKVVSIIVVVAVIVAGIVFVPRLVHKCSSCEQTFFGTGYKANVVADLVSDEEQIICKDCAETQHALEIAVGKQLKDYKRPLFGD